MDLVPCTDCRRHVERHERACPFCGGRPSQPRPRQLPQLGRLTRAAIFYFSATTAAACGSDEDAAPVTSEPVMQPYGAPPTPPVDPLPPMEPMQPAVNVGPSVPVEVAPVEPVVVDPLPVAPTPPRQRPPDPDPGIGTPVPAYGAPAPPPIRPIRPAPPSMPDPSPGVSAYGGAPDPGDPF